MKNAAGTRSRLVAGLFSKPPLPTLEDLRPAAKFENIDQLVIDTLKAQAAPGVRAAVFSADVRGITLRQSPAARPPK